MHTNDFVYIIVYQMIRQFIVYHFVGVGCLSMNKCKKCELAPKTICMHIKGTGKG